MASKLNGTAEVTMPNLDSLKDAEADYETKLKAQLEERTLKKKREPDQKKKKSDFSSLFKTLTSAQAIADYIKQEKDGMISSKNGLNNFMQAISQREDSIYEELFSTYKGQVSALIGKIVETVQGDEGQGKMAKSGISTLSPATHEFIIRCEEGCVREKAFMTTEEQSETQEPDDHSVGDSLMTTGDMLKYLATIDVKGKISRKIEMANSGEKIQNVAYDISSNRILSPHDKILPLTRLISKTRRILAPSLNSETGGDKEELDTNEEKETVSSTVSITENSESSEVVGTLVDIAQEILSKTKTEAPTKFTKFIEWCKKLSILPERCLESARSIEITSETAIEAQASSLEVILKLKQENLTKEEFINIIDDVTVTYASGDKDLESDETPKEQKKFKLITVDILSAIAVAAGTFKEDPELREYIMSIFVNTSKGDGTNDGVQMPRRVLTFIAAERLRRKQAEKGALKRLREEEDQERVANR